MHNAQWLANAGCAEVAYGAYVDYDDGFYICPECGEPVHESDWTEAELEMFICPICEFKEEG